MPKRKMPGKEKIQNMFNSIAGDYDRLNHLMSLDMDRSWRKKAVKNIIDSPESLEILDLACGTGDFSILMARKSAKISITGVDLSEGMLAVMKEKVEARGLGQRISMETGDGENLRFARDSFDRVTIAFGIRNFEDKDKGLREMLRVLRTGGSLTVLELSLPQNRLVKWLFNIYFLHILPLIGGKISGDRPSYNYLPASVVKFPGPREFMAMMQNAGFTSVSHRAFTFGICRMFTGKKA